MDLDQIQRRIQSHFSDGLVVVVGSGLSCAEGLPGMGELAGHLQTSVEASLSDAELLAWQAIKPLIQTKGLEAALHEKPPSAALEAVIASMTARYVSAAERKVIQEVFNGGRKLRFTRLMSHLLKPAFGIPIITTNYDRLLEVAIEEAGISVDSMFVGHFCGSLNERESLLSFCRDVTYKKPRFQFHYRSRAAVFKPHGSLDWYLRDGKPVRYAGDLEGGCRLIITPGHNKFRNGYESPFDLHRTRGNEAIDKANRFLVIGYGFNDDHLETHLSPAIRSGKPTLMATYALSEVAKKLALNFPNVLSLERGEQGGVEGLTVTIERQQQFLPGKKWWDIEQLVREVLEP